MVIGPEDNFKISHLPQILFVKIFFCPTVKIAYQEGRKGGEKLD